EKIGAFSKMSTIHGAAQCASTERWALRTRIPVLASGNKKAASREGAILRRGWFVAAGAFLALFAATTYLSFQLPLLDTLGPGPGFFPLILALLGGALSVA